MEYPTGRPLFVIHTESSHGWGGQEIRILTESKEFLARGHRVLLLADPGSLIYQRSRLYDVPVQGIRLKKKRLKELAAMWAALSKLKPDVVSTHSSTDHWIVALARIFLKIKPRIVRTRHVSAPVSRNAPTRWLYNRGCDAIMTTGESIRRSLIDDGFVAENKVTSVPTGIDLNFFKVNDKKSARQRLSIAKNVFVFGNLATLRSWKGQVYLIEAFAKIKHENTLLLIVGDGPMREALHNLVTALGISEQVVFAGHQSDVRDYLDAMDVFVFPSYANEGIPQAILQALAYGLPIITTDAGSILEAVDGVPNVKITKKRDVTSLSHAMAESLTLASPNVEASTRKSQKCPADIKVMANDVEATMRRALGLPRQIS